MKIISSATARAMDRRSVEEFGYSPAALMESAAIHIWRRMKRDLSAHASLVAMCGAGNNGADGLAIARLAHQQGHRVAIVDCATNRHAKSELNRMQSAICDALGIPVYRWDDSSAEILTLIAQYDGIIDALTGIGGTGGVRERLHPLVLEVNQRGGAVYAVDVPSGISEHFCPSHIAVRASITYTVELPKLSCLTPLARPYCGTVAVVPIGFPAPLLTDQPGGEFLRIADIRRLHTPLSAFVYKHMRGVVAVYGGGGVTTGAALLAADGASASGAGLIHLFPNSHDRTAIALSRSAYIVHHAPPPPGASPLPDAPPPAATPPTPLVPPPALSDALCVGPGWGVTDRTRALFDLLIGGSVPGVIDADALTILGERISFRDDALQIDDPRIADAALRGWVLTPHCSEFARLLGVETALILQNPLHYLRMCARQLQSVIVLKSYVTYIAHPDGRYAVLDGAEVTLATAGSGDILAGMIAALLARGYEPFSAARLSVLAHYHAGRVARKKYGYYRADALIACIAHNMLSYDTPRRAAIR